MKKITKLISLLLAVCSALFMLTSCTFTNPPEESAFKLQNDFTQRTVKVGEQVTYKVMLKNMTDDSYTLQHTEPLITFYIISQDDAENGKDNEVLTDELITESDISPNGQIEKFTEFTPAKSGKYLLRASCKFTIEGKDYDKEYEYSCADITITVE